MLGEKSITAQAGKIKNALNRKMNIMKKYNNILFASIVLLAVTMSSCEIVGDLVEFGVWVGVIIVVAIVALIWWIIRKFKR